MKVIILLSWNATNDFSFNVRVIMLDTHTKYEFRDLLFRSQSGII